MSRKKKIAIITGFIGLVLLCGLVLIYGYIYSPIRTAKNFIQTTYTFDYTNMQQSINESMNFLDSGYSEVFSRRNFSNAEGFVNEKLKMQLDSKISVKNFKHISGEPVVGLKFKVKITNTKSEVVETQNLDLILTMKKVGFADYLVSFVKQES